MSLALKTRLSRLERAVRDMPPRARQKEIATLRRRIEEMPTGTPRHDGARLRAVLALRRLTGTSIGVPEGLADRLDLSRERYRSSRPPRAIEAPSTETEVRARASYEYTAPWPPPPPPEPCERCPEPRIVSIIEGSPRPQPGTCGSCGLQARITVVERPRRSWE